MSEEPVDEIADYWDARYLSAGEATWRILGFHVTKKEPAVTSLPIHLPGSSSHHQYLRRDNTASTLSLLDRYFQRPIGLFTNASGIQRDFSDLTYAEYFTLFRLTRFDIRNISNQRYFDESDAHATPRMHVVQRDVAHPHLSRINAVRPSQGELFYLRAILQSRPALSFVDARTVNGQIYETFQEAAVALGLFADHNEAQYAIHEAIHTTLATPRQLRLLFVHLLVNDCVLTPIDLWANYKEYMARDFTLQLGLNIDLALNRALEDLGKCLEEYGKSLAFYGLPEPTTFSAEINHELERWGRDPVGLSNRAHTAVDRMTHEQRFIYEQIMTSVMTEQSHIAFVDGKAGRGKTFLVNAICDKIRSLGRIVIPTATAAFAAQLYPGGRTTHSVFKVSHGFLYIIRYNNQLLRTLLGPCQR